MVLGCDVRQARHGSSRMPSSSSLVAEVPGYSYLFEGQNTAQNRDQMLVWGYSWVLR